MSPIRCDLWIYLCSRISFICYYLSLYLYICAKLSEVNKNIKKTLNYCYNSNSYPQCYVGVLLWIHLKLYCSKFKWRKYDSDKFPDRTFQGWSPDFSTTTHIYTYTYVMYFCKAIQYLITCQLSSTHLLYLVTSSFGIGGGVSFRKCFCLGLVDKCPKWKFYWPKLAQSFKFMWIYFVSSWIPILCRSKNICKKNYGMWGCLEKQKEGQYFKFLNWNYRLSEFRLWNKTVCYNWVKVAHSSKYF